MSDDPHFRYGTLPIFEKVFPPDPNTHRVTFLDIGHQILEHLETAVKNKDERMAFRVMAKGERILNEYVAEGFSLCEPLQRQLQDSVFFSLRVMRREFIRRALTCAKEEQPQFDAFIKSGKLEGPGAVEDYEAVERHLDEGRALFDDLRRKSKIKLVG